MRNLTLLFAFVMMFLVSGCYWNSEVKANEMAVQLDKGKIVSISGPGGVYSDNNWFSDLDTVSIDTLTFSVEDPEVLTKDNQAVSVRITIQARRKMDTESIKNLYVNWNALKSNDALIATITSTAREGMKNGVRGYTLTELLDDRNGLADMISVQLEQDVSKYSSEIINVTIENIGPSQTYMDILAETANIKANTDKAKRQQDLINQQAQTDILTQEQRVKVAKAKVIAEQAETAVQVEIAKREGAVKAAQSEVYSLNPQAFILEELRLLKDVLGQGTVYFIPAGTDLTTYLLQGVNGQTIPVK